MFDVRQILTAGWVLAILQLGACASGQGVAAGPSTPGWTGRTVVLGNNSTIVGNAAATELQQKWPLGRGR